MYAGAATPASLGTSSGSTSIYFFVASPTIIRTSRFSCEFCQKFRFSGKCNVFVGNCFLRTLESAKKVHPQEGSNIIWEVYKIIRKKYAIFTDSIKFLASQMCVCVLVNILS